MKTGMSEAEKAKYRSIDPKDGAPWFGWHFRARQQVTVESRHGSTSFHFEGDKGKFIRFFPSDRGGWQWKGCDGESFGGYRTGDLVTLAAIYHGGFIPGLRALRQIHGLDPDTGEPETRSVSGPTNPNLTPSETKTPPRETVANSTDAQRPAFLLSPNLTQPASALTEGKKADPEIRAEYLTGSIGWSPEQGVPTYLVSRGIAFVGERFRNQFRVSTRTGRCRFMYWRCGEDGTMERGGFESKGQAWKSYTERGTAGFWAGGDAKAASACIVESPIDALSHAAMTGFDGQYLAVRMGGEADASRYLSKEILSGRITTVLIATDNDDGGHHYETAIRDGIKAAHAERARLLREEHGKEAAKPLEVKLIRRLPINDLKDWNDELKARLAGPEGDELLMSLEVRAYQLAAAWAAQTGEGDAELRPAT